MKKNKLFKIVWVDSARATNMGEWHFLESAKTGACTIISVGYLMSKSNKKDVIKIVPHLCLNSGGGKHNPSICGELDIPVCSIVSMKRL